MGLRSPQLSYNRSMRSGLGHRRSVMRMILCAGCLACAILPARSDLSQSQSTPVFPQIPGPSQGRPQGGQEGEQADPAFRRAEQEAAKKRNIERQNKITANSDRILLLAQEMNSASVSSPEREKKAAEIEKLAHSVRDLMRTE
jgi:hypothetical protein